METKRILVVAAHPDDEVLGCGAAIAVHTFRKEDVFILILADGVTSRSYNPLEKVPREKELRANKIALQERKKGMYNALKILGVNSKNIMSLNLPDQRLDTLPFLDIVKRIERIKKRFIPNVVYTHFFGDLNLDHRITCEAVLTSFRPLNGRRIEKIYCFEIPETTGWRIPASVNSFNPNYYVDVSETIGLKLEAIKSYNVELRKYPHPRSPESIKKLAIKRGKEKFGNVAEAFVKVAEDI